MNNPFIKFGRVIVNVNAITTLEPQDRTALRERKEYEYRHTLGVENFKKLLNDNHAICAYRMTIVYEGGINVSHYIVSIEDCERLFKLFGND